MQVLSAHLLQQQALSAHPPPRKKIRILLLPSFPFYIVVNHILEYVSVIFSNVESFAIKALVALNCGSRFNGSIILICLQALRNLLICCLIIWKLFIMKWCYEFAFIVIIVKTMFRFWPRSPSESAPQIKVLDRNLSAFSTLFAPGKSWDNVRSTTAPYTESRLALLVRNKRVGFPVVEQVLRKEMEIRIMSFILRWQLAVRWCTRSMIMYWYSTRGLWIKNCCCACA